METNSNLLQFLQEELAIGRDDLNLALHKRQRSSDPLPMLLWQYGLISLNQLQSILDWLDRQDSKELSNFVPKNSFLSNYLTTF
ncbi:DUF2949 domain-containing protein [Pannus brasiliensis CCIBt3594]|uniref:DUF2949 domain-containing protein n=1 Tax=Pannus brasiliensis CCIBt3594 TaxID=1427578 RepID=A0AAW9QQ54_9CHRO